jgi:omega-amidase
VKLHYNEHMRVYMPRFNVRDLSANLARLHADCDAAAQLECELALFPEQFLSGYHGENNVPRIKAEFGAISAKHPELLFDFGTLTEDGYNQQHIYLDGEVRASYKKVHLFEPNGEHELWQRGESYTALRWGQWRIGLLTCNDVRFPEQARALKLMRNVNLLLCPALWPAQRDHVLSALQRARAIENGAFMLGCCIAGVDNGEERFDGALNHAFDPLGNEIYPDECVYTLDPAVLERVTVDTRAQYREITQVDFVPLD